MDIGVDAEIPLDYATIQIIPSQNRYEAFVCCENKEDTLAFGVLDSMLSHLPKIKELYAKGSNSNFKLQVPGNLGYAPWFTKSTLKRFLHIVASPDLVDVTNTIKDEIAQLEETKQFHLSLYDQVLLKSEEIDGCNLHDMALALKPEVEHTSSDASKIELLRAMDLRLYALRRELDVAFNKAAGSACTTKEITDLSKFSEHFGATSLKNFLCSFLKLNEKTDNTNSEDNEKVVAASHSRNDGIPKVSKTRSVTHVKYGVSPAKVAQVERQCSTETEESSNSSEDDGTPAERSRSLIRSASPRRSASPMRRIQIGKTGSRRVAAVTIKSLNHLQTRERVWSHGDVAAISSEDEGLEQPSKKPENVRRMSVQDAISLFESKQRNQTGVVQNKSSLSKIAISSNKSVFRRLTTGVEEISTECQPEIVSEVKEGSEIICSRDELYEAAEADGEVELSTKESYTLEIQADSNVNQEENVIETLTVFSDCNGQQEATSDHTLVKNMKSKPAKCKNPQAIRMQTLPSQQRGGVYECYKAKRDEKLRGENVKKRANKEAQFRVMQKMLDDSKAKMISADMKVADRMSSVSKHRVSHRNSSQPENTNKKTSNSSVMDKNLSKNSLMYATRKSWPSSPSPRTIVTSPAKMPGAISSSDSLPKCRRPQPKPSSTKSSTKMESSRLQRKYLRETRADDRSLKCMNERTPATTNVKVIKREVVTSADGSGRILAKSSLSKKVTKKSSVVPLESKPHRKCYANGVGAGLVVNKTSSSVSESCLKKSKTLIEAQESGVVVEASDMVCEHEEVNIMTSALCNAAMDSEPLVNCQKICGEGKEFEDVAGDSINVLHDTEKPSFETQVEEPVMSLKSWVDIEEHQDMHPSDENTYKKGPLATNEPVRLLSPRVRHSLHQMLQEESEHEMLEWGNAEIAPDTIYQKEPPKGLKRLLKFSRKSKGGASMIGSSPSVVSEGEDTDESNVFSKRNALRKTTLTAKKHDQMKGSLDSDSDNCKLFSAQSNTSLFGAQNLPQKLQQSHRGHTTRARSFFSLSAFRGSKPKLR